MEDSSLDASSEDPRDRDTDVKERDTDCSSDITDERQSDLRLGTCMLQLFEEGLWTDISFRCSDQSEENFDDRIHAHKIVLAARSQVFQAMFFGPCKDSNTVIEVQDAESQYFKLFLRLLYSDQYHIVDEIDDLENILEIAHKYQVTYIVDECCKKLAELLDEKNACSILERALFFDNKHLIKQASDFIDENANDVLQSEGFLDISVTCITYILKGDTFYAEESKIFERAIEWSKQKCKSTYGQVLRKTLGEAFFYLRTPIMPLKDFVDCTHRKGYYTTEEYEDIMAVIGMSKKIIPECNSVDERFPLHIKLTRLPLSSTESVAKECIRNETLTENISISSIVDIYLTSVTLIGKTITVCNENQRTSSCMFGNFSFHQNAFKMQYFPVSVSLILGDTPTIEREVTTGPGEPCIKLKEPFFLSARESVILKVKMKLNKIPGFPLTAFKCDGPNELRNNVPDTVEVVTKENSARVVQSLEFKCVNNRD